MNKNILGNVLFYACLIMVVVMVIYGIRIITNTSTPITITHPSDGIVCAMATTSDGVALSCWKGD